MSKTILDLCGGTGAWSKPYKDAEYRVEVITLPIYDVTKVEFKKYGIEFIRQDKRNTSLLVFYEDIYGILAAPPCTEFSVAKGDKRRDFIEGIRVVEACLKIIWSVRYHKKIAFWALENPRGFLRQFLGKPAYTFEQWEFGDDGIKYTDIWGYFNSPTKTVKQKPEGLTVKYTRRTNGRGMSSPKCPKEYCHLGLTRAALRAITPSGFAQAFYKANK